MGGMKAGSRVEAEYDVPRDAWYFDENGHATLPFCVLMEAALQPCGWLASYVGSTLQTTTDLMFRNLDGTGTLHREITPGAGTLRTRATVLSIAPSAGMIIETFAVECFLGEQKVYEMTTAFGFFPKEAFENQAGLPASPAERERIAAPGDRLVSLRERPARYCGGSARLAGPMLLMLDRITAFDPSGGKAGKGWVRAEKDVDPGEWFFKAHFFQDPVQPGSLGVEALCQLLQWWMLETGMTEGLSQPRFEPVAVGRPCTWKYRGQVVPGNRLITTELEVIETGEDECSRFAVADGALWVDGTKIYTVRNLAMRLVGAGGGRPRVAPGFEVLDPAAEPWISDHRPTWTVPVLPMMSMVDRMAGAALLAGREVCGLDDVALRRWLLLPGPVRLRTEVGGDEVVLSAWRDARDPALSRFEPVASGRIVETAGPRPEPLPPLADAVPAPDPYAAGVLFHGPAFGYLKELRIGGCGASAILDAGAGSVPYGTWHQGLLDAMVHAIPQDRLSRWSAAIPEGLAGYPYRVASLRVFAPLPREGALRLEVRFAGFDGGSRFPAFDLQVLRGDEVLVAARLVEILVPMTRIGMAPPAERRAFLGERRYVGGLGLSVTEHGTTTLAASELAEADWLPGNAARIYALPPQADALALVAVKDHVARVAAVHPSRVEVAPDLSSAVVSTRPLRRHPVTLERARDRVAVRDAGAPSLDLAPVRRHWDAWSAVGRWPMEDLYYGLISRFVADVVVVDPDAYAAVRGRSCLYLANHQVAIESLLFSVVVAGLSEVSTITLAKAEHRTSWIGGLIDLSFSYPGVKDPGLVAFFEREDRDSLPRIVAGLAREMATTGKSVMVHVEGTRSLSCRHPVIKMSSAFVEMALGVGAPIVPVRFVGGLPGEELPRRLEFPLGHGRQEYWIGPPIAPEELQRFPLKERKQVLIDGINALGPPNAEEAPAAPDHAFADAVDDWVRATGATPEHATLFRTLEGLQQTHPAVVRLVEAAQNGRLDLADTPEDRWLAELARRLFGAHGPRVGGPR
jgi:3-hydroxymyristoyl/3-hydroxydecanoyl-(acyl carrier protein) dehydratase/1-acyl-sn-glycerol-3-phosphate acyltransferase